MKAAAAAVRLFCAQSLFILLTACICPAYAQTTVGIQPYGSYQTGFDQINLSDLGIHIDIPLFVHKGRGVNMGPSFHLVYDTLYGATGGIDIGWRIVAGSATGGSVVVQTVSTSNCPLEQGDNPNVSYGTYSQYAYAFVDSTGYAHPFAGSSQQSLCTNGSEQSTSLTDASAADGSGYRLTASGPQATVTTPSGSQFSANISSAPTTYITDANGNDGQDNSGSIILPSPTFGYSGAITDDSEVEAKISGGLCNLNQYAIIQSRNPTYITYTDTNGDTQTITISYAQTNIDDYYSDGVASTEASPLVSSVSFPDGSGYQFTYQQSPRVSGYSTGILRSVQLPGGGTISYQYTYMPNTFEISGLTRTTSDGTTTYSRTITSSSYTVTTSTTKISKLDNSSEQIYFVYAPFNSTLYTSSFGPYLPIPPLFETSHTWLSASGTTLKSTMRCYNGGSGNCTTTTTTLPITQIATTTTLDNGQSSKQVESLNASGLQTELDQYDYGASAPSSKTITAYASLGNNITAQPGSATVTDGSGNTVSQTTFGYDEYSLASSGVSGLASISGSRGNRTSEHDWNNVSGTTVDSHWQYDNAGQVVQSQDPSGIATNVWTVYGHDSTDTYITSVTPPTPSSGVSLPTSATYDPHTGLVTSTTDPNGTVTKNSYDSMLRIASVNYFASTGGQIGEQAYGYTPTQLSQYQYQNSTVYSDTETQYDGYGRQSRVAVANGQGTNPWYQTDTCYNSVGQIGFQSYRYQGTGFGAAKVCSGSGDSYSYDALVRPTSVAHSDGTTVSYSYTGRATETTDENGVSRITQVDGLGRATAVCELSTNSLQGDSPSACGTDIGGTGYLTSYTYNLANHTTTATQGVQTRVFQTDSLGRTTLTQEPERGETTYSYAYNSTGLQLTRQRPQANQACFLCCRGRRIKTDVSGRARRAAQDGRQYTPVVFTE